MTGLLVMAYGSPRGLADLEAYYTHIRGGRRPSPELLEELAGRYRAIGGRSPLPEITERQARALETRLNAGGAGPYRAYIGMKHAAPFIADAVAAMAADGVTEGVGVVLAPHYSRMSVGTYIGTAEVARRRLPAPFPMRYVERWGEHPAFVEALAASLRAALAALPDDERPRAASIFTAHSLPETILAWGDPYPDELRRTSAAVAARAGVTAWRFAFQSAGRTPDPWLGPDVGEVIAELGAAGVPAVAVCPVGFVADHLEVLYDLEIEARAQAGRLGMRFVRAASLNDHPLLIDALADVVLHQAVEPVTGLSAH
ncbi:MAG: ferrochelatase [Armatimonadota bacterium]|nr:ferrochelatase [Armatimonadota bacterium]